MREIESNKEALDRHIREDEEAPEGTEAVVISFDGVNVLLSEPGRRKGRKAERPKAEPTHSANTAYRHAMVGSISYYGKKDNQPERMQSRYAARMPETNFLTFRKHFEQEIEACFQDLPKQTKKLVITDGHPVLQNYIRGSALLKDCDVLIDFYHAMEHLSVAAEAIFGKSSEAASKWFQKWRQLLLNEQHSASAYIAP